MIVSSINNDKVEVKIIMTYDEMAALRNYNLIPEKYDKYKDKMTFDLNRQVDYPVCQPIEYMEAVEKLTKALAEF